MKNISFKEINGFLAAVIIPIVVAVVANIYSTALKERELEGRFVELAVKILSDKPTEENKPIRKWATEIINKFSGVPLGESAEKTLIESEPITKTLSENWEENNHAHTALWMFLKWTFNEREVTFGEMSSWSISRLEIHSPIQSDDITEAKTKAMAAQMDRAFIDLFKAKYEDGADQKEALSSIAAMLSNSENKISDLADIIDTYYQFLGE